MAFTREVIQPISFKQNWEIPSFLSLQIIWATERYEDVSSFRLPLNIQLANSYKIWKDSSWAFHLHRSALPRGSASQTCPPQYQFGLAPGILSQAFQLMSLILAQQIILLITDKNRGCSSALLSRADYTVIKHSSSKWAWKYGWPHTGSSYDEKGGVIF